MAFVDTGDRSDGRADRRLERLIAVLATLIFVLSSSQAAANGWEHAAISFDALVTALNFEHPETRRRAAESLGLRGDPQALPPLRERLARPERNPFVRDAIYTALGRLGDEEDSPTLIACIETESREEIRARCTAALGQLRAPQGRDVLLNLADSDSEPGSVKSAAVLALSAYPEPKVIAELGRIAGTRDARAPAAVAALGSSGATSATAHLLAVLDSTEDPKLRALCIVALGMIGDPSSVPALVEIAETETDPGLRIRAVAALASVESGSPTAALIGLLSDPLPGIQLFAIHGLHQSKAKEAGGPLALYAERSASRLTDYAEEGWQHNATQALETLSLLTPALRALADLDPDAGAIAMISTARLADPGAVGADTLRLKDALYRGRRAALYGLGYASSDPALETLLSAAGLRNSDPRLRAVAVRSIAIHGRPQTVPELLRALDDPAPEVRMTAARVLGLLQAKNAMPALRNRLADSNRQVRVEAATALGLLHDQQAAPDLTALASSDPEQSVRTAAQLSLQRLQNR